MIGATATVSKKPVAISLVAGQGRVGIWPHVLLRIDQILMWRLINWLL